MCFLRLSSRVCLGLRDAHYRPLILVLPPGECPVGRYYRHDVLNTDNAPSAQHCPVYLIFLPVQLSHLVSGAVFGRAIVQNSETLQSRGRCSCKQLTVDILAENFRLRDKVSEC